MHAAAQRKHLFDQPRADVGVLLGRHHEDGLDLRVQPPIHQRHLELELEVRHGAQAAHDDLRPAPLDVVDQQPVERIDLDVGVIREHGPRDLDPLVDREERRLLGVHEDRHDDAVEQPRAAQDDVDVAVGQRIERAGINGDRGHATPQPFHLVKRQRGVAGHHRARVPQLTGRVRRRIPPRALEHQDAGRREHAPGCREDRFEVVAPHQNTVTASALRRIRRIEQHDVERLERGLIVK